MEHSHLESLYPETSRHWEIEQLLAFVKRGESCEMIAFPGVGRGNLFKFLCYNRNIRIKHLGEKQSLYHFVFINFAEIKNRDLFAVTKFIFLQLTTSLHERLLKEEFTVVDKLFKKYLGYKDDLVLFEGLKEAVDYLAGEKNLHIIFLFERFELYIPKLTDEFFINLRSLRDTAKYKFCVIFSTTRPLEETVDHAILADFYEFFAGKHVFLHLYDTPGILFRISYLEKIVGEKINPSVKKNLLIITGGHGKLTRLGTEILLGYRGKGIGERKNLETFLLSQKTIQQALKEIWEFLIPAEQTKIKNLELRIMNYESNFLENIGLIKDDHIAIPIFTAWLKKNQNISAENNETLIYDPNANTIKKGDLVISENLTASEFRLLKYFLENPNKVLERENIINSVWKNNITTLGVTDQAFDQLIFRLRKKIEQNPNAPVIIETVKGRGIKYNRN